MSDIISFSPNVPMQLSLREVGGQPLTGRFAGQVLFELSDGRGMLLDSETAGKIAALSLRAGEQFSICKHEPAEWTVWLTPQAEKARAAAERYDSDLEEQLQRSIDAAGYRGVSIPAAKKPPVAERSSPQSIRGTGTNGPAPQPVMLPAAAPTRTAAGKIPFNVACREILGFVTSELKASGEQWNDQAKQDLVSTVFIAAAKAGMLGLWERGNG